MEASSTNPRRRSGARFWRGLVPGLLCFLVLALLQTSCVEPTASPRPADMVLHVVSGDSQVGIPFEELPEPIVVQVVDTVNNQPVFNQVINFRVVEDEGSVFAGVAHTNENGIAQEYWTLGEPGPQRLEARAVTSEGDKVVFGTFSAVAVEPFDSTPAIVQCLHTDLTWRPYRYCDYGPHLVESPVTVDFRVLNADTIPIPGTYVRFEIDTTVNGTMLQDGAVSPDSVHTDSLGVASATWTLGQFPGDNRLLVSAHSPDTSITEAAWATGIRHPPPPDTIPAHIRCLEPNGWWRFGGDCVLGPATVNTSIPVTFQVVAADSQPIPNIRMFFAVDTSVPGTYRPRGSVTPDSAVTDSMGTVTVRWTLGPDPGENAMVAYVFGYGATIEETVRALGVADSIPIDSVPAGIQCRDKFGIWRDDGNCAYNSVPEGTTVQVAFRVVNPDTMPLPHVAMDFEITEGDGSVSPESTTTDSMGTATVNWKVGSFGVGQELTASVMDWSLKESVVIGVQQNHQPPVKVWWENPHGGDWTNGSNWTGGKAPESGDTVCVTLAGDYEVLAESDSAISMGLFELGSGDSSTTQSVYIDGIPFLVDGFGSVHPGGLLQVDSGGTFGGTGMLFVVGGAVQVIDGSWSQHTMLDSGAFVFDGQYSKSLGGIFAANGGTVTWNSADTLLMLEDSASILVRDAELVLNDTMTVLGGNASHGIIADSAATVVFKASADRANYLQMSGVDIVFNGEAVVETTSEPASGTVFDLVRLIGGATFSGIPMMVTAGYTLQVNPEAGVGLRAVKN